MKSENDECNSLVKNEIRAQIDNLTAYGEHYLSNLADNCTFTLHRTKCNKSSIEWNERIAWNTRILFSTVLCGERDLSLIKSQIKKLEQEDQDKEKVKTAVQCIIALSLKAVSKEMKSCIHEVLILL
uniref:Uncharacterized protein n=1 Tax=Onchocerca volvulus TaxID=6282 RepID=A0A8R1TZZ7_ONCVO